MCICAYMHFQYMHIHVYAGIPIRMYIHIYTWKCACIRVNMYACMLSYIHIYRCTYVHMDMCIYICIYTCFSVYTTYKDVYIYMYTYEAHLQPTKLLHASASKFSSSEPRNSASPGAEVHVTLGTARPSIIASMYIHICIQISIYLSIYLLIYLYSGTIFRMGLYNKSLQVSGVS